MFVQAQLAKSWMLQTWLPTPDFTFPCLQHPALETIVGQAQGASAAWAPWSPWCSPLVPPPCRGSPWRTSPPGAHARQNLGTRMSRDVRWSSAGFCMHRQGRSGRSTPLLGTWDKSRGSIGQCSCRGRWSTISSCSWRLHGDDPVGAAADSSGAFRVCPAVGRLHPGFPQDSTTPPLRRGWGVGTLQRNPRFFDPACGSWTTRSHSPSDGCKILKTFHRYDMKQRKMWSRYWNGLPDRQRPYGATHEAKQLRELPSNTSSSLFSLPVIIFPPRSTVVCIRS